MGTQSATGPLHSQRRDNAVWMAIRLRWEAMSCLIARART